MADTMREAEHLVDDMANDYMMHTGENAAALLAFIRAQVERAEKAEQDASAWRAAQAAVSRVFTGDAAAAGADFVANCPLGDNWVDPLPAENAALRTSLTQAERNRQYTCQAHADEVRKGGSCCWCQLAQAQAERDEAVKALAMRTAYLDAAESALREARKALVRLVALYESEWDSDADFTMPDWLRPAYDAARERGGADK